MNNRDKIFCRMRF